MKKKNRHSHKPKDRDASAQLNEQKLDQPAEVGADGKKHKECVDCGEILEEEVIDALPPEEDPTDPIDATDDDVTGVVTDEPQSEQSSSEKPAASAGGCNSSLLPIGAVTIVLMLAAIPTFLKKKREE